MTNTSAGQNNLGFGPIGDSVGPWTRIQPQIPVDGLINSILNGFFTERRAVRLEHRFCC